MPNNSTSSATFLPPSSSVISAITNLLPLPRLVLVTAVPSCFDHPFHRRSVVLFALLISACITRPSSFLFLPFFVPPAPSLHPGLAMVGFIAAPALVGFLSEPDTELQVFALQAANEGMSLMWTEFAAHVSQV
ncbi:MAG: hypothetical protein INR71_16170 [Terriglobus roseus]|nr:hypothetical protein [Terriglobus roseus]